MRASSCSAAGQTGVLWPNDRDVAELAPYLDRLALVALAFPNFKDGRAYSQARILRERHRFRGELRATGQVLRDQFLFLHSRRLRRVRGDKTGRRGGLRGNYRALQRFLPARDGWPGAGAAPPPCEPGGQRFRSGTPAVMMTAHDRTMPWPGAPN